MILRLLFINFLLISISLFAGETILSRHSVDLTSGYFVDADHSIRLPGPYPVSLRWIYDPSKEGIYLADGWYWDIESPLPIEEHAGPQEPFIRTQYNLNHRIYEIAVISGDRQTTLSWIRFEYQNDFIYLNTHHGQSCRFEINGSLISVIDSRGIETHYSYLPHSLNQIPLLERREEGQTVLINKYDQGKVKTQWTNSRSEEPELVARYDYENGKTTVIDPKGNPTVIYFDDQKRISAVHLPSHRFERKSWDDKGRLISTTIESENGEIHLKRSYAYNERGQKTKETIEGNITGLNDHDSYTHIFEYAELAPHLLTKEIEDNGRFTTYTYLPNTHLIRGKFEGFNGQILKRTIVEYNSHGLKTRTTIDDGTSEDPDDSTAVNQRFIQEMDLFEQGLPTLIEEKRGDVLTKTVLRAFTPEGHLAREEIFDRDARSQEVIENSFDTCGNETFHYSENTILSHSYDNQGHLTATYDLLSGQSISTLYDLAGRPIQEKFISNNGIETVTTQKYNEIGELTKKCSESGLETDLSYDALGRITVKNEEGATTCFEYDVLDQISAVIDPSGGRKEIKTNIFGDPLKILYPDNTSEEYTYNLDGTLATFKSKTGQLTKYEYDWQSRITSIENYSSEHSFISSESKTYDSFKILSETHPTGASTIYTYNDEGQKIGIDTVYEEGITQAHLQYNSKGLVETVEIGERRFTAIREMGEITQILMEGPEGFKEVSLNRQAPAYVIHDPIQLTTTEVLKDGSQIIKTEDPRGQPLHIIRKSPFGEIESELMNSYDLAGRKTDQKIITIQNGIANEVQLKWEYDAAGRLIRQINNDNQVTTYDYDQYGRVIATHLSSGITLFTEYNEANQTAHIYASDHSIDHRFAYDYNGNILEAIDEVNGIITTRYYNALGMLCYEQQASGYAIFKEYDQSALPIAIHLPDGSILNSEPKQKRTFSYPIDYTSAYETHYDALNRPILETQGACWIRYQYDPLSRCTKKTIHNGEETFDLYPLWDGECEIGSLDESGQLVELKISELSIPEQQIIDRTLNYFLVLEPPPQTLLPGEEKGITIGSYGNGEFYQNCRISFINGINVTPENFCRYLKMLSSSHGGNNIHYSYLSKEGWTTDMMKAAYSKLGTLIDETYQLAHLWKKLLSEIVFKPNGLIFHYAHSLGGTVTLRARELFSDLELKKIRVITFGTASIIADKGFHSVKNFVSKRDGITLAVDPIYYFKALIYSEKHVVFIGSIKGIPLIDHLLDSYWQYWITNYWHEFTNYITN